MISMLRGTWRGDYIDVGGVGYDVEALQVPVDGSTVEFVIRSVWRETSGAALYGFSNETERACFDAMCKVTRVGPSAAMSVLRSNGVGKVVAAIKQNNPELLAKSPGVGKKTLELICGYTALSEQLERVETEDGEVDDVYAALIALGYGDKDARRAVSEARATCDNEEDVLREALRNVGGSK